MIRKEDGIGWRHDGCSAGDAIAGGLVCRIDVPLDERAEAK